MNPRVQERTRLDTIVERQGQEVDPECPVDKAVRVLIQPDGRILVGANTFGFAIPAPISQWGLLRYEGSPAHTVPFFLQGGVSTQAVQSPEFGLDVVAPAPQTISVLLSEAPRWTSEAYVTGIVGTGASVRLLRFQ